MDLAILDQSSGFLRWRSLSELTIMWLGEVWYGGFGFGKAGTVRSGRIGYGVARQARYSKKLGG